jgi:hypothetical protein
VIKLNPFARNKLRIKRNTPTILLIMNQSPIDLFVAVVGTSVILILGIVYCYKYMVFRMCSKNSRQVVPGVADLEQLEIPSVTFQVDAVPENGTLDSIYVEAYKDNLVTKTSFITEARIIDGNDIQPITIASQV